MPGFKSARIGFRYQAFKITVLHTKDLTSVDEKTDIAFPGLALDGFMAFSAL